MQPPESAGGMTPETIDGINQISQCDDEYSVHVLLRSLLPSLGAESYVYVTLLIDDPQEDYRKYRLFIGCAPEFTQLYNARKWFMIDPYLNYSRTNSAVVCGEEIPLRSAGQQEMREAAARFGFRSLVVVPSHSGSGERFGTLYIGSEQNPPEGNAMLLANRVAFRSIAMELLDWWARRLKTEMMERLSLTESETMLLQLHRDGYRAQDIADELGISVKAVHNRVRVVKEKFNVDNIGTALRLAASYGLLK